MLLACSASTATPAALDLSSCDISGVALVAGNASAAYATEVAAATHAAPAQDQQSSLQPLSSLVSLDLSDNRLGSFAGLTVLTSLQQLNLSANRLKGLQCLAHTCLGAAEPVSLTSGSSSCSAGHAGSSALAMEDSGQPASHDQVLADSSSPALHDSPQDSQETAQDTLQQQHALDCQEAEDQGYLQGDGSSDGGCEVCVVPCCSTAVSPPGFSLLEVLDVSYNLLPGEVLLGQGSPLGLLPRQVLSSHSTSSPVRSCVHFL